MTTWIETMILDETTRLNVMEHLFLFQERWSLKSESRSVPHLNRMEVFSRRCHFAAVSTFDLQYYVIFIV